MARQKEILKLKKQTITIIGEGLTEQFYFHHIRNIYDFRFILKPYYFGTTSYAEMERKVKEILEGNGIAICVFDTDIANRNEVEMKKHNAFIKKYSKKKNIIICDSLPSIEYWFLLHHLNTNRHFNNAQDIQNELLKFINNYDKTEKFLQNEKWVSDLCADNKIETAITRAIEFSKKDGSYSNIYKAIECFKK